MVFVWQQPELTKTDVHGGGLQQAKFKLGAKGPWAQTPQSGLLADHFVLASPTSLQESLSSKCPRALPLWHLPSTLVTTSMSPIRQIPVFVYMSQWFPILLPWGQAIAILLWAWPRPCCGLAPLSCAALTCTMSVYRISSLEEVWFLTDV